jgi:hypothetical protein
MAGHAVTPVYPALTPVTCKESYLAGAAGVRSRATVTLYEKSAKSTAGDGQCHWKTDTVIMDEQNADQVLGCESGELQWTSYGVSGIVIFQLSRQISACREPEKRLYLEVDLLPEQDEEALIALLTRRAEQLHAEKVSILLEGVLHEKLVPVILQLSDIPKKTCCGRLGEAEIRRLVHTAQHLRLTPTGTKSFDICQVCRGGVDTSQVRACTLESSITDGLYFAGELLDVDGLCGGYNLQWAWASGYAAGMAAAGYCSLCDR